MISISCSFISSRITHNSPFNWKTLWSSLYPQRALLFSWKCLNNTVKVRKLLHHKNISNDAICSICTTTKESVEHALFLCNHARLSWFGSNIGMLSHSITLLRIRDWWNSFMDYCGKINPPISPQTKSWVLTLWWALRKSINNFIFRGTKIEPISTIIWARRMVVASMANNEKAFK